MPYKGLFTEFRGRIPRSQYWLGMGTIVVSWILVIVLIEMAGGQFGKIENIVYYFFLVPIAALMVKRSHDLDLSLMWGLFPAYSSIIMTLLFHLFYETFPFILETLVLISVCISLFVHYLLGCRCGTQGDNQHGSNPLKRSV
jgi:uncharacterized membrane protein YhaH (DUF805 family)